MFEIKKVILTLGMEFRVDSDFKIKCVRRRRVHHHDGQKQLSNASVAPDDSVSVMSSNLSMDRDGIWTSAKTGIVNGKKKGGIRTLLWRNSTSLTLSSSPPPPVPPLPNGMISSSPHSSPQARNGTLTPGLPSPGFLHNGASRDIDSDQGVWVSSGMTSEVGLGMTLNGSPSLNSSSNHALPPVAPVSGTQSAIGQSSNTQVATGVPSLASSSTIATSFGPGATSSSSGNTGLEPLYGEDSIDSGEEVRFSIEVCRIKNLMGIYCVDIRRMKGNLWAYKFLYHAVLNTLDLNGKGGYIPTLGAEANNAAAAHAAAAVTNLTIQSSK
ncbi:hypothetical protein BGW38_009376 [Lunasporangiospora selenospora]|uniref:non-specific serine/threonine protein kinase n=1 Tax=Lunasporangiospora selenospora TaxID=979761 RepID=A0A9P6FIZ5_9FUNG|nr:hypothetical protein BGW38_009376 [Lunasporangiospora selenospora]